MKNNQKFALIIWFYIGWFGCVYFAKWDLSHWSLIFPLVPFFYFLKLKMYSQSQLLFLLFLTAIGVAFDWALYSFGWISFPNYKDIILPTWLISMWFLFSSLFFLSHDIFRERLLLAGILGIIFGPLSYYSGEALQVMTFSNQMTFIIYAAFWGLYFPLLHYSNRKFQRSSLS